MPNKTVSTTSPSSDLPLSILKKFYAGLKGNPSEGNPSGEALETTARKCLLPVSEVSL